MLKSTEKALKKAAVEAAKKKKQEYAKYLSSAGEPSQPQFVNPKQGEDYTRFASGASSSPGTPRFDLIPREALGPLADRFEKGLTYGRDNWRKGVADEDFLTDRFNHTINHLYLALSKSREQMPDDGDDDLAAAAWGCIFLIAAREIRKTTK